MFQAVKIFDFIAQLDKWHFSFESDQSSKKKKIQKKKKKISFIIPLAYKVYRGYIVFAFSITMFVMCVCLSVCVNFRQRFLRNYFFLSLVQALGMTYCIL